MNSDNSTFKEFFESLNYDSQKEVIDKMFVCAKVPFPYIIYAENRKQALQKLLTRLSIVEKQRLILDFTTCMVCGRNLGFFPSEYHLHGDQAIIDREIDVFLQIRFIN
jgi:hypothetical protein